MSDQFESDTVLLSDLLQTLQKEVSRAREGISLSLDGPRASMILDDVSFRINFNFTPVNAGGTGDNETIDAILVHATGPHQMSLEGKIAVDVELETQSLEPSHQITNETQKPVR